MLISRRLNCVDASSSQWPSGAQVEGELQFSLNLCTGRPLTERTIPDAASTQFNLLMMII